MGHVAKPSMVSAPNGSTVRIGFPAVAEFLIVNIFPPKTAAALGKFIVPLLLDEIVPS
jgi:hypothetical protein